MGHYWRDIGHPPQAFDDWSWTWLLLHGQYSLHLRLKLYAQPSGRFSLTPNVTITDMTQYGNMGGKSGYVWAGTGFICFLVAFVYLPEMKGRSYREIDIMFKRKIPARKWKETVIDVNDDE